jgi:drug/metabolite transporter (DMT)-like permease
LTTSLLGILSALASALSWGGGDFSGGYASRRSLPFQVLVASGVISMLFFLCSALIIGELSPTPLSLVWAMCAGFAGALGLGALYQGLAKGSAAIVSPTAAVLGASIPVVFSALSEGLPRLERLVGICLGVIGIWLVSLTGSGDLHLRRRDLTLAFLAGGSFAAFFIFLGEIPAGSIFFPLAFAKVISVLTALIILIVQRQRIFPAPDPILILVGVLEAGGNWGYLLARQLTRLDIAVVLSSMYPAVTVVLAWHFTHQHISKIQLAGITICLLAVVLIAL